MTDRKINLPNNVRDAIRDNLSGQVSQILRTELESGAAAKESLLDANLKIGMLQSELGEHTTIARAKSDLTKLQKATDKLIDELADDSRDHAVFKLTCELNAEKRISMRMESVLSGLVRNQEWRETVNQFESSFDNTYNDNGTCNTTETKHPSDTTKEAV